MKQQIFHTSVARIADFDDVPYDIAPVAREAWREGDYVVCRVCGTPSALYKLELTTGRMIEVMEGDLALGTLGTRAATLEGVGNWSAVGEDGLMEALTGAGLFGKLTSASPYLPRLMALSYVGHVQRDGRSLGMGDFVAETSSERSDAPVIVLVGTSMSAGKTTAGRVIIHELKRAGKSVVGVKLTGAGRYRDILSYSDAGADHIFDFVDAGLPSTVVDEDRFETAMAHMLGLIAPCNPDVIVAEAGASPMEPYNGAAAIAGLGDRIALVVLCASDPYAVVGVQSAFGLQPDIVTGPATNTSAGRELVTRLSGVRALSLSENQNQEALARILADAIA